MERPSKEEMEKAKVALFDYDEPTNLAVVDRSTLERAASCPWSAKAVESGRCRAVGVLAEAGEQAHKAFSETLHSWIDSNGAMERSDLRQDVEFAVRNARPDLQPDAIRAIQGAIWSWSELIYKIHPGNILAFDGGEDIDRSGQLAIDFADLGVRYTSELDLLYQGDSLEVGEEVDYKTGWKTWTIDDIRDSFQFQSHAVLALEKYPQWKALRVRVFDTRHRNLTYGVYFPREKLFDWKVRIRSAIDAWRVSQQDEPPCWPVLEKCSLCPAASICPVADEPIADLSADPVAFVTKLIAVEARASAMSKLAAGWVDANKRDIQAGDVYFGRGKPPSGRKAIATIYSLKGKANVSDSD
jgi:hypothetical protein